MLLTNVLWWNFVVCTAIAIRYRKSEMYKMVYKNFVVGDVIMSSSLDELMKKSLQLLLMNLLM